MGRRLGQHFLRDGRMADAIVQAAGIQPNDHVLEIGPGPGVLTHRILDALGDGGHLTCIELDEALAAAMRDSDDPRLTVVEGDAMRVDLGTPDIIVSNLPYQISGPITARLVDLQASRPWRRAVLMYQKEFADRLLAGPGSKAYGRLSVYAARRVSVRRLRDVPPGAFDPPPKVRSTVVVLEPHKESPFLVANEKLWRAVVDGAFGQRRKQLRNTLPGAVASHGIPRDRTLAVLDTLDLANQRPEALAPETFASLVSQLVGAAPAAGEGTR